MTQISDISEIESGLSLLKEDKPFSDKMKLKVYYISDMHLEHHFDFGISIQKQVYKIVKDLFSDDFKSNISMNHLVVLFNGDIADNAEFVSLFFEQFILRWNYVLYKRYEKEPVNKNCSETIEEYKDIISQYIDKINNIGKKYKKRNLCERLLSLDKNKAFEKIQKLKLPDYTFYFVDKIHHYRDKIDWFKRFPIFDRKPQEKFSYKKSDFPIYVTLGNHEISKFDTLSQAYDYYKKLYDSLGIKLLHNNSYEFEDYVVFGGIGFAKYNEIHNANTLCGPKLFTREDEIEETNLFLSAYNNELQKNISLKKKIIVASHYPVRDWLKGYDTNKRCTYFTGHTHQNQNIIHRNIYADNQIGYYDNCFQFKSLSLGIEINPFFDYEDGYHLIDTKEYAQFYKYSKEHIQGTKFIENQINKYGDKFYMIKHKGKYAFFLVGHLNTKICIGGTMKTVSYHSDIEHFDKIFDKMIGKYTKIFAPYWNYMNKMSSEVKSLGYYGDIHGCIVDLDFCNHIMVNPYDQKVTFYNSPSLGEVRIFDDLEHLIAYINNGYISDTTKQKMIELKNNNAIISKTSQELSQEVGEFIKIDIKNSIYEVSRYMKQIQRLFQSNILRDWNESLLNGDELYLP